MAKTTYRPRSIQERLDLIRIQEGLPSDYKLALFLGIGETALANYRKGRSLPDAEAAMKISTALGEDPGLFLVELEAMRAKTPGAKVAWGAVAGLVAGLVTAGGGGGRVDITSVTQATDAGELRVRRSTRYASYEVKKGPLQLLAQALHSAVTLGFTPNGGCQLA